MNQAAYVARDAQLAYRTRVTPRDCAKYNGATITPSTRVTKSSVGSPGFSGSNGTKTSTDAEEELLANNYNEAQRK